MVAERAEKVNGECCGKGLRSYAGNRTKTDEANPTPPKQWEKWVPTRRSVGEKGTRAAGSALAFDGREHRAAKEEAEAPIEAAGITASEVVERGVAYGQAIGVGHAEIHNVRVAIRALIGGREVNRLRSAVEAVRVTLRVRAVENTGALDAWVVGGQEKDAVRSAVNEAAGIRLSGKERAERAVGEKREDGGVSETIVGLGSNAEDHGAADAGGAGGGNLGQLNHDTVIVAGKKRYRIGDLLVGWDIRGSGPAH